MSTWAPAMEVRRAADRYRTTTAELDTRHSFSFGAHYDPANTSHGLLVAHNDELVRPGGGYPEHPHRDTEVVTWVLSGSLEHEDSTGASGVLRPGLVQVMTSGRGVLHRERNGGADDLRFVQVWLPPDESGLDPSYAQADVGAALAGGALVPVVSGLPRHAGTVPVRNGSAALHVARPGPGQVVELPDAPFVHLFVAGGAVVLDGTGALGPGDAARLTATGGRVTATEASELLVWEMHRAMGAGLGEQGSS